jgi:putative transposase
VEKDVEKKNLLQQYISFCKNDLKYLIIFDTKSGGEKNMPYVKIWVHAVWSTKNRTPFLKNEIRDKVLTHIFKNAQAKGIKINIINGYEEHVHCLISLQDHNISKVLQLLKGESAFWINKEKLCHGRFEWQEEYFAVSIGESQVKAIRAYIQNQEEHHKKKNFDEEYQEFKKKYNF